MRAVVASVLLTGCSLYFGDDDDSIEGGGGGSAICANDDGQVPGGGVTGDLWTAETVRLCVVDGHDRPVAQATVHVGAATFTTNDHGRAQIPASAAQSAPYTIAKDGFVTTSWLAVTGDHVTIPLEEVETPNATVVGTIAGWDDLPLPAPDHYQLAVVTYSRSAELGAPENNLGQAANTCKRSAVASVCEWQLSTRLGRQRHAAVIVDADQHGTDGDYSDDTYTLVGYAFGEARDVLGDSEELEVLEFIPADSLVPLVAPFYDAPAGLDDITAVPYLDLGDEGRLPLAFPPITPSAPTLLVPSPETFDATYDLLEYARPLYERYPYSMRGAVAVSLPEVTIERNWLPQMTISSCGERCWLQSGSGTMNTARFSRDGVPIWNFRSFSISASVPADASLLGIDPLDGGPYDAEFAEHFPGLSWSTSEHSFAMLNRYDLNSSGTFVTRANEIDLPRPDLGLGGM